MLSIHVVSGRPFLRRSIVDGKFADYRTLFEELVSDNKCLFTLGKRCTNLFVSSTPSPDQMPDY